MAAVARNLSQLAVTVVHHEYRLRGGEERCVERLCALLDAAGATTRILARASSAVGAASAGVALARGGNGGEDLEAAARAIAEHDGPSIVHAHNLHPTFGRAALQRLRDAGAAVVLHLHNYRLFCAIGTSYRAGGDCFECAPRTTWHGLQHNCRGDLAEAVAYAIGLRAQQRAILEAADVVVTPTAALAADLVEHGILVAAETLPQWLPPDAFADESHAGDGTYGLFAGRITEDKGVFVAIRAAAASGVPLKVAGDGPAMPDARRLVTDLDAPVELLGQVDPATLASLRDGAAFALLPSLWREVQPFAAVEALAAAVPLIASDTPALNELTTQDLTFPRSGHEALAARIKSLMADPSARQSAGNQALAHAHQNHSETIATERISAIYELAIERRVSRGEGDLPK